MGSNPILAASDQRRQKPTPHPQLDLGSSLLPGPSSDFSKAIGGKVEAPSALSDGYEQICFDQGLEVSGSHRLGDLAQV